jgi:hypothetical protein
LKIKDSKLPELCAKNFIAAAISIAESAEDFPDSKICGGQSWAVGLVNGEKALLILARGETVMQNFGKVIEYHAACDVTANTNPQPEAI